MSTAQFLGLVFLFFVVYSGVVAGLRWLIGDTKTLIARAVVLVAWIAAVAWRCSR